MFEDSVIGETMEREPWWKGVAWFAAGCLVVSAVFAIMIVPKAKRSASLAGEQAAQRKFEAELARNPLTAQLQELKAALQAASQEQEACKAKFDRETILYDNSVLIDPGKEWIIPADVEPIILTDRSVSYTHYDPKEKRESAHFHPTRQNWQDAPK
jgi:hypothetical protein